ncbi:protein NRT1/ PTR FAMILY 3.1-like [Bidens hawaiensis]|uniref:protein NRT1/ PTR FAMILY 3.1-like n=1 Tax=Bidens hawaiensis TaxID=980011 RepID=UPI00404AD655
MAEIKTKGKNHGQRVKGGLITMPFIFANEAGEKLAVVGFQTNMISYLTKQFHMPMTKAANTLTNFTGTASLTPLLGAFVADSFAGRFWTITVASIIYQIGLVSLTLTSVLPKQKPSPSNNGCEQANSGQLAILYISLLLLAIGSGGIRPCVVPFGAEQFNKTDEKQKTSTWKFFDWYYFCMGVSKLVAVTVIVYIQDNIGWGWGLGVPSIAMTFSIIGFVIGYPLYRNTDPAGSPFTRLVQVCVAAYKKRKLAMVSDPKLLYENNELDASISISGKLIHTKQMKFLDKAAIVTKEDFSKGGSKSSPNLWRLNTVHRVEELKTIIRMGPIWASGILPTLAYAQQGTFSLQQAKIMNTSLTKSIKIPAASMIVFTLTTMLLTIIFYDRIFVPIMRKITGRERGITFLTRMGIGFSMSALATLVSGFVEIKRKHTAFAHGLTYKPHETMPISVLWLVPQYSLYGMADAFTSIGRLEFLYDQSPESMRSTATALFWLASALANYESTLLVTLVHKWSAGQDGSNWLRNDNLNKGKLEYFYWLITLFQVLNLIYYLFCAKFYTLKPIQVASDDKVDGVELGPNL